MAPAARWLYHRRPAPRPIALIGARAWVPSFQPAPASRARACARETSISTTSDIYADWDIDQLADTMRARTEGRVNHSPRSTRKALQIAVLVEAAGIEPGPQSRRLARI